MDDMLPSLKNKSKSGGSFIHCPYALPSEQCGNDHTAIATSVISFRVLSSCQAPGPPDISHLVLLVYFVTVLGFLYAPYPTLPLLKETGVTAPPVILSGFCMPLYNLSSCPCMSFLKMNEGPFDTHYSSNHDTHSMAYWARKNDK